jgi:hypothetical protein
MDEMLVAMYISTLYVFFGGGQNQQKKQADLTPCPTGCKNKLPLRSLNYLLGDGGEGAFGCGE